MWLILASLSLLTLQVSAEAASSTCVRDSRVIEIPTGAFSMGSDRAERDYGYRIGSHAARKWRWFDNWELLRKRVILPEYFIDKNLTTQAEYRRFVWASGHRAPFISPENYKHQGYLVHSYESVRRYLWGKNKDGRPTYPKGLANHPVVLISQSDAQAHCAWRNGKSPARYRLPTEAEWEKAARGVDARYFPWGNTFEPERLNYGYKVQSTTPVGAYPKGKSPFGVLDMAGNVFEWTSTPFSKSKATMKGGGSWDDQPGITRAAARHGRDPKAKHLLFGFRCVCVDP